MMRELRALLAAGWVLVAAGAGTGPVVVAVDAQGAPPGATVTVEQRNKLLEGAMAGKGGRVEQLSAQDLQAAALIRLLALQTRSEITPDWAALEKAGVPQETTLTMSLFSVTFGDAMQAILWQMQPEKGKVGYKIENGVLTLLPVEDETPLPESEDQKRSDAALVKRLKEPLAAKVLVGMEDPLVSTPVVGAEHSLDVLLRHVGVSNKINLVVSWPELKVVGLKPDDKVTLMDVGDGSVEGYLKAVLAATHPVGGTISYDIRWGMLRISTTERLAKEKKLSDKAEKVVTPAATSPAGGRP